MKLENTTNELYKFFDMEPLEDPRDFSIVKLNQAYLKKKAVAYTTELMEKTKDMYNKLYANIQESLTNFKPKDDGLDMFTLFDEFCDSVRYKPETAYRRIKN